MNLIKAQQYRTLRDNATYITIALGMVFYALFSLITIADSGQSGSTLDAGHMFVMSAASFPIVLYMVLMALTSLICGSDMLDRTINYEPLDGARRSSVFFSRFILALCWGLGTAYLTALLPMIGMGVFSGWGNIITVGGYAKRMALMLLPFIRIIALYTALTFILGDWRAVFAIGFTLCQIEIVADAVIAEVTKLPPFVRSLFSAASMNVLLDVDNLGFDYLEAEDVTVVKDMMTAQDNILCSAVCAVTAVALLALGLAVFRKKDLK